MNPQITIEGNQVYLDGVHAGSVADCVVNYPALATEIQAAWDAVQPPAPVE